MYKIMYPTFGFFDFFPVIFSFFFVVIFLIILGIIIFSIVSSISTWNKNNNSPLLTVDATIVAKRVDVTHHSGTSGTGDMHHHHSHYHSSYYVTFQVESGDRIELLVKDNDYGLLVEGDFGKLTFQGTRYKGFHRITNNVWTNNNQ